jgi:hypothetical protein
MKRALSAVVLSLGLLVPAICCAQELGQKGDAVFSADRLMGVTGTHVRRELQIGPAQQVYENDWTAISFGWRGSPDSSPFDVPRFSFDYVLFDHFTVGGSLGYAGLDPDDGDVEASAFLLAVRAGYAYAFGRVVGIWPRGGFTYHTASFGDDDWEDDGLALTLECPFTFSPATHFAFHVGPTFDIDFMGERDTPVGDGDSRYRSFGVNAGILGWF